MSARPTLREWLAEGPYTLTMSSGFFGFFAHAGVMTTLEDAGLLPERVTGSSAGALVGGGWAAGVDAPVMRDELMRLERRDFWDPFPGPGVLRGKLFRQRLDALLPSSAFEHTRVPAALSAFDVLRMRTVVLSEGDLAAAIHASCCVPLMFHPVWIGGRPYLDGGILDRPGIAGVPDGQVRVLYHHLTSKSPWRRKKGAVSHLPRRQGLVSFLIDGLTRCGPFKLENGAIAFEEGRKAARTALERPIDDDSVLVQL
jgi:NTE family protein